MRSPPGKEIYQKGSLSVFEVDGKEYKVRKKIHIAFIFKFLKVLFYILALLPMPVFDSQIVS